MEPYEAFIREHGYSDDGQAITAFRLPYELKNPPHQDKRPTTRKQETLHDLSSQTNRIESISGETRENMSLEPLADRLVPVSETETKEKMNLVLAFMDLHHELMPLEMDSARRSITEVSIFSQTKNLPMAKKILHDVYGIQLRSGSFPYQNEAIHLNIENISKDDLMYVLACFTEVIQTPEVSATRHKNAPNIALREPPDPLLVYERLTEEYSLESYFEDRFSLHWLDRVINTYNTNVAEEFRFKIHGSVRNIPTEYAQKAKMYSTVENLKAMHAILCDKDTENHKLHISILDHYEYYKTLENELIEYQLGKIDKLSHEKPNQQIETIQATLKKIVVMLKQHEKSMQKLPDGRTMWPIVA